MTTREFIRNLKLLKEARMGLVQVRLGQLLMQKIGLVCIIRANFDSVLTTSLSSTLKRILPGQRSDKINGLSMQQWATLLKLKMSGKAHGSGDYDDERGGRRNALAAFATLATTVLAGGGLFQYLQSTKGQENLASFFKWGKQLTKDQVGATELENTVTEFKRVIIDTNKAILDLVKTGNLVATDKQNLLKTEMLTIESTDNEFLEAQRTFITEINNNTTYSEITNKFKKSIEMPEFLKTYNEDNLQTLELYHDGNKIENATSGELIEYFKKKWNHYAANLYQIEKNNLNSEYNALIIKFEAAVQKNDAMQIYIKKQNKLFQVAITAREVYMNNTDKLIDKLLTSLKDSNQLENHDVLMKLHKENTEKVNESNQRLDSMIKNPQLDNEGDIEMS
jgi:hypothetical protein